jgi:hypothetical protein
VAESRAFHLVWVDRDATPDVPARFHVSAYPSLLVLGPGGENIHRWSGFRKPAEFLVELRDGKRRADLFAQGEAWDAPRPRPDAPFAGDGVAALDAIRAPSDEVPGGIVRLGGELFVAQGRTLFVLEPKDGAVRRESTLAAVPQDLDTDGESLLVLGADWTKGEPVLRLDPRSGAVTGRIAAPKEMQAKTGAARGLCWHAGKLFVLEIGGTMHEVDGATGELRRSVATGLSWVFGLTFDGDRLVTVGRDAVHWLDPDTLRPVRTLPSAYRLRTIGWDGGRYLILEQPEFGFGRRHEPIRVWPQTTVIHRLAVGARK